MELVISLLGNIPFCLEYSFTPDGQNQHFKNFWEKPLPILQSFVCLFSNIPNQFCEFCPIFVISFILHLLDVIFENYLILLQRFPSPKFKMLLISFSSAFITVLIWSVHLPKL